MKSKLSGSGKADQKAEAPSGPLVQGSGLAGPVQKGLNRAQPLGGPVPDGLTGPLRPGLNKGPLGTANQDGKSG